MISVSYRWEIAFLYSDNILNASKRRVHYALSLSLPYPKGEEALPNCDTLVYFMFWYASKRCVDIGFCERSAWRLNKEYLEIYKRFIRQMPWYICQIFMKEAEIIYLCVTKQQKTW